MLVPNNNIKQVALLLDPDDNLADSISNLLEIARESRVDYILVGGSMTFEKPGSIITLVKESTDIPVYIFPGNLLQLDNRADGILLLSLISGRNPELLIGNHVIAAPELRKMKVDIIPVGYILISCGPKTSVEYMSQTEAIPSSKHSIAVATAMAGEMLGMKMIYLEAGSGAEHPVPDNIIRAVSENTTIPLIVGGGLGNPSDFKEAYAAGADIIVIGNGATQNPDILKEACRVRDSINSDIES